MKFKRGDFINLQEKAYRHVKYTGVVTEVFTDLIQIYGGGYEPLGFHEFQLKEITIRKTEREKVIFLFRQAIRQLQSKKLSAEIKFKNLEAELVEAEEKISELLK